MPNRIIATEHPGGAIYAAIESENDRWELTERIAHGCGTSDLAALWNGTHEHHGRIVHQEAPVPDDGTTIAVMDTDGLMILVHDMTDGAFAYFGMCSDSWPSDYPRAKSALN